jgi:hypothetical protein
MEEQIEDDSRVIGQWIEAFRMEQDESGSWRWASWLEEQDKGWEAYNALLRDWNRFVPEYNAAVVAKMRPVGRPIGASEAQQEQVRKLRKAGHSLRAIAEETSLGLQTVVTVVGKGERTDRTAIKYLKRIDPDRAAILRRSQARAIRNLPRTISSTLKAGAELLKQAKGLK